MKNLSTLLKSRVFRTCLLGLTGLLLLAGTVQAQELDWDDSIPAEKPTQNTSKAATVGPSAASHAQPLSITISKTLYLPPEMYGQWSVTGTLIETNAEPGMFKPLVYDIWVLENRGDEVIISNPANGASAAINVDNVEGNKATFHRMVTKKKTLYFEMPTITVYGDSLRGVSVNKVQYIRDGKIVRSYYANYNLEATRISAARVKFKPEEEIDPPSFEIEEVQSERSP